MNRPSVAVLLVAFCGLLTLSGPTDARANGVAQLVKLTYVPGISNFGPKDAEGILEFSFAERYARAEVKNLLPEPGYTYEGWMRNAAGDAMPVGVFRLDASGLGSMEGTFEGITRYDYNLFVIAARPPGMSPGQLATTISIAGNFTIIDAPGAAGPTDSRPLELPAAGERPEGEGLSPWRASLYTMAAGALILIGLNTLRARRARTRD